MPSFVDISNTLSLTGTCLALFVFVKKAFDLEKTIEGLKATMAHEFEHFKELCELRHGNLDKQLEQHEQYGMNRRCTDKEV